MRDGLVFCVFSVFVLFLSLPAASAIGLGINKARIEFKDVLRNGYAEDSFIVSTDSSQLIRGGIEVEGPIADWLSFDPANVTTEGFEFSASKPMRIKVILQPPDDAANGDYNGTIRVITGEISRDSEGRFGTSARAAFKLGAFVGITGVEKKSCVIGGMSLSNTEVGQPSDLKYYVKNTGNVRVKPVININFLDKFRGKSVGKNIVSTENEVLPTTSSSFLASINHGLGVGQYWAEISSPDCSGSALVTFDVLERGGIADEGDFVKLEVKPWADVGEIVPITGVFQNNGVRTVSAKMKGTISLGHKIVKQIDTDFYDTPPGAVARIETFFNPSVPGQYEIKAVIFYNNKITYERTSYVNIRGEGLSSSFDWGLLLIVVVIILLLLLIIKRRRRRRW